MNFKTLLVVCVSRPVGDIIRSCLQDSGFWTRRFIDAVAARSIPALRSFAPQAIANFYSMKPRTMQSQWHMMVSKPIQSDDNFSSKSASEAENIVPGHRRWNQKSTVVAIALHRPGEGSNKTFIANSFQHRHWRISTLTDIGIISIFLT